MIPSSFGISPLSAEKFPRTHAILRQGLTDGVAPGFVAGFWTASKPEECTLTAVGNRRLIPTSQVMEVDTVFDLASVSKVLATTLLTAMLVDRGWIRWDTPVQAILPEFRHRQILISHLLSHTAGFKAWEPLWEKIREKFSPHPLETISVEKRQAEMRRLVFLCEPEVPIETRGLYSDISFLVLGFALEAITQMPLDHAVKTLAWDPLGLSFPYFTRTTKNVEHGRDEQTAATENCPWRGGVVQGQVHDDNTWAMGGYAGHAGAFARGQDVLFFAKKLFENSLSAPTLQKMWTKVSRPPDCSRTLGWDTPSGENSSFGQKFSTNSVGHLGFTGTSLWIDIPAKIAVILLSNRIHPSRENIKIRELRPRFHDALWEDLHS